MGLGTLVLCPQVAPNGIKSTMLMYHIKQELQDILAKLEKEKSFFLGI